MMKRVYVAVMMIMTMLGGAFAFATPTYAATCQDSLLGIPAWYRGMQDGNCSFKAPETGGQPDAKKLVLRVALNIIQAGMVIVAYVTIFFLITGGFRYITSAGSSDGMAAAKKTITNAIIGLVIAILAASIVNAIAGAIK